MISTNKNTEKNSAAILAKLIASPATREEQETGNTSLAAILAKLIAAPSTSAKQDAILAKLIAAPSTAANQALIINALGILRPQTDKISVVPVIDGAAYADGDNIGGIMEFLGAFKNAAGSGFLHDLSIWDTRDQKAPMTLFFFSESPVNGAYVNNAAMSIALDSAIFLGRVNIAAGDYETTGGIAVATITGIGLTIKNTDDSTRLFCVAKINGVYTYVIGALTFYLGTDKN